MVENKTGFLYFATFVANLAIVAVGATYSWSSPVILKLRLENNPLGRLITPSEESWLLSLNNFGSIFSPAFAGILSDRIGRKGAQLLLILPIIIGHIIFAFFPTIEMYYIGRVLVGIGSGGFFSVLPLYLAEIAEVRNRGALGCLMVFFSNIGTFSSYIIGPYVSIQIFSLINLVPAVAFLVLFSVFIPESPYFLANCNRKDEALKALEILRGGSSCLTQKEFEQIIKNVEEMKMKGEKSLKNYMNKPILRGLFIIVTLMCFQQLTGITAILGYMQMIFEKSGSDIKPEIASIIVGVVPAIASFISSILVERMGRKILLCSSLFVMCLALSSLATFFQLQQSDPAMVTSIFWLPTISLLVFLSAFNSGTAPVSWSLMGELFAPDLKAFASTMGTCSCFISCTFIALYFPQLLLNLGFAMVFWVFAICCIIAIIFVIIFVPETRGKTFLEIQEMLKR